MLLLTTSFLGYPLPRSHRHGGFEKKMFPSTSYSFLFQIKAVAHMLYLTFQPFSAPKPSRANKRDAQPVADTQVVIKTTTWWRWHDGWVVSNNQCCYCVWERPYHWKGISSMKNMRYLEFRLIMLSFCTSFCFQLSKEFWDHLLKHHECKLRHLTAILWNEWTF